MNDRPMRDQETGRMIDPSVIRRLRERKTNERPGDWEDDRPIRDQKTERTIDQSETRRTIDQLVIRRLIGCRTNQ